MARGKRKRKPVAQRVPNEQRPHLPNVLGPRTFFRGRWAGADLRPWGGARVTLRNPAAPGWPTRGERTDDPEVADRWKWKYVDELRDGSKRRHLGLAPKARQLGDRVDAFLAHRLRHVSPQTVKNDHAALEAHLVPRFGERKKVDAIDTGALQEIVDGLVDAEYRVSSIGRIIMSWGAFFGWLGQNHNPARGLALPDPGESDVRSWTDDELEALRTAADGLDRRPVNWRENRAPYRLALELGLGTGGRQAELAALDWEQFRHGDRTVRFNQQVTTDGQDVKPLKGKVARTALVLPSWWHFHRPCGKGRVLVWEHGRVDLSTMYTQLKTLYDAAGLNGPGLAWHTLRHTYSRIFLEMGGRLEELQKSLGHASISTTERYYAHFAPESATTLARLRIYGDVSPRLMASGRGR